MNILFKKIFFICGVAVFWSCSSIPKHDPKINDDSIGGQILNFLPQKPVRKFVLKNGLVVMIVEDHSSPTFAMQTWFRVGSRNETPSYTGLAHLFEHMMFKATKNMPEGQFDRTLEQAGVEGENAFTTRDCTAYVSELPSHQLELILKLESDRMQNLVVDEAAFKTEREVVQNERRYRTENNPDGTLDQTLFELAFTAHPYHWPVIGYADDLDRMTSKDAEAFYKNYYAPNFAIIALVGDVKTDSAMSLIDKYYGHLSPQPTVEHPVAAEPTQVAPKKKQIQLNIEVEKLALGYHIPELKHSDMPAIILLRSILLDGKSARLHRALVETGLASSVSGYELDAKDPSLFMIMVNMQAKKKAALAENVIIKELSQVAKAGVSLQELKRAINKIEFQHFSSLKGNSAQAEFLGHYEAIAGDYKLGLDLLEAVKKVTPEDITRVSKKYFDLKNRSVVFATPKKGASS